jgi:quinohemoprotein amine dehydrogenase
VRIGKATLENALTVYQKIDRIAVEPAFAVGRVGGNEGSEPVEQAIFDARAFANGADGAPGTADDVAIGVVRAQWSVAAWDEQAVKDRDVEFAGTMDKDSGVFTPAAAGPNPARKYGTNNAGNLKVIATVREGDAELSAEARLLVTVQRWNNPPIR